ncbi:serine/threonine protein kinase [Gigaspora margarita]|uniref:Serine/threonine protein kinase n=1 Tax=Gigaspora margarita TaxID=4874 RepID=A0A8H3XFI6_GIGMA|nr:serine/threonine protein kinase [Gigaspora margarita]
MKNRYGVLSSYDQTWFLQRGIIGDHDWLRVSDPISNASTDPTLLKSIAYIIFVASNSRYAPYIDKPILITDEESSNSGTSDNEQKDDKEFKYKKALSLKEPNVVTRSQSTQIE